ncbi:MAG: tetratricopeptide repeat protein, partial [Ignavibacteriales bacterium]|nr:tetratricopeptide repeat protein [Ignavibacteriales bacterium]
MRFSLFHFSPFPKILTGLFFTVGFISFVFSLNAEEKNARFESAKELYHKGNYYEAHHLLEKEIHQGFSTATREEAIYLNAECLVKLNRDKEAREQFYLFLREYPYSRYLLPVSQRLGELDFQSRNFEQAITWYKNALDKSSSDETSAITSFNVGESYLAFGDSTNALKYSLLSTEFSASSLVAEKAFVLSAGLLYANGKIGEASILYDTLLVLFPGSPSAKIARIKNVEILFAQGKFTKVLEVIDATDIDSLSIDEQAHLSYAGIQSALALKNYHKTIFLSEQFLQRFPEHKKTGEVRLMLGRLYFQEKRIFEAEEIFRDAVGKKDEHSSAALYHLASTLKFNGKNEESRSLFEQVSKEQNSPFQSYGLFEQSLLSFSERRYAEAELFLQKIFSLDSLNSVFKNDSVLYAQCSRLLGAVYYTQERYNDARKMFTVARSVKGIPDTLRSEILWNEGWAMYKLGKFSGAAQCFETVAGKSTNQRDVYFFWTGEACYRAGNFDKAKVYYSQITEQHKTSAYYAEAISGYGWCAFAQRDYYEAEKAFEKLILEQPNSSIVQEAYLRLGD